MKDLTNKKLLIVSGDSSDIIILQAAKEMGLTVVCCDAHTDWTFSPAKKLADEAWNIDYSHTEEVAQKCREFGIDGVIAGYAENRVLAAARISKAIGTPFYATEEQIQLTRNKGWFKKMCAKHGLHVPQDYSHPLPLTKEQRQSIQYPVIVKPSDNGGRKGISICRSAKELDAALALAQSQSLNGEVVIEEYITGDEMSSVYTISDGKISLSCVNDKYICDGAEVATLCNIALTPSRRFDQYVRTVDPGIKSFLKDMGATNGLAYFQLIVDETGIKPFEMGFRINGNDDFKVIRRNNGLDYMKMLIHYSITGEMGDDLERDNPRFSMYTCTLCIYVHGGTIKKVDYSLLIGNENVDDIEVLKVPGNLVIEDGTNKQKAMVVKVSAKTLSEIIDLIDYVQAHVIIEDTEGKNMLIKPFDTKRLL